MVISVVMLLLVTPLGEFHCGQTMVQFCDCGLTFDNIGDDFLQEVWYSSLVNRPKRSIKRFQILPHMKSKH